MPAPPRLYSAPRNKTDEKIDAMKEEQRSKAQKGKPLTREEIEELAFLQFNIP